MLNWAWKQRPVIQKPSRAGEWSRALAHLPHNPLLLLSNLNYLILPIKTWEPGSGLNLSAISERQSKHPTELPSLQSSLQRSSPYHLNPKTPQTQRPSLLLPVCLPTHPPDSLLFSMILFHNKPIFTSCPLVACSAS